MMCSSRSTLPKGRAFLSLQEIAALTLPAIMFIRPKVHMLLPLAGQIWLQPARRPLVLGEFLDSERGRNQPRCSIPSWQSGLANAFNGASSSRRNVPDVAMEGNTDNCY